MYKIIDLGSNFEPTGETRATLIDGSLVKTASSAIQEYWNKLERNDNYAYLWVIGVSALEYYGCNNNGDAFYEEDLKKTLPDWSVKAHIYQHHVNKDPRKSLGKPIYAFYNDDMHRVELILAIDRKAVGSERVIQRIKDGEQLYVSMGCNVAYDVCSICGHKSRTRAEYCDHLKFNMKKILPDGRQVFALNPNPRFFDISLVTRPADPTAFALDKLASERTDVAPIFLSADLGKQAEELEEKIAAVRKVADIIKQVRGEIVDEKIPAVENVRDIEDFSDIDYPDLDYAILDRIGATPSELFSALGELDAPPTLADAYWCSGLNRFGVSPGEAFDALPDILDDLAENPELFDRAHINFCAPRPVITQITIRVIRPIAERRIGIINSLASPSELVKMSADFFRQTNEPQNVGSTPWQRAQRVLPFHRNSLNGSNFQQIQFTDHYGNVATTTPYALRHNEAAGLERARTIGGAALGFGALAGLIGAPGLTKKLVSGLVLGLPAYKMLSYDKNRRQIRSDNTGELVPARIVQQAWKDYPNGVNKTASRVGALAGMALPGAMALDYAYNNWKYGPGGNPNANSVHKAVMTAGKTVHDNPLTALAVGGTAGAGLVGAYKYRNYDPHKEPSVKRFLANSIKKVFTRGRG